MSNTHSYVMDFLFAYFNFEIIQKMSVFSQITHRFDFQNSIKCKQILNTESILKKHFICRHIKSLLQRWQINQYFKELYLKTDNNADKIYRWGCVVGKNNK